MVYFFLIQVNLNGTKNHRMVTILVTGEAPHPRMLRLPPVRPRRCPRRLRGYERESRGFDGPESRSQWIGFKGLGWRLGSLHLQGLSHFQNYASLEDPYLHI